MILTYLIMLSFDKYFKFILGDDMRHNNNRKFSTYDRDQDATGKSNCASNYHGAWWFGGCFYAHLNGHFISEQRTSYGQGIIWNSWHGFYYSLKSSSMMLRCN